jgi:glycosyltransferase involved in cell wall biosynthesis
MLASMGPLVTVIISTYNSSPFLVETLESVLNQTWKELELIITDDCSGDNTVRICRKWLNENKQRFFCTGILTSEKNTGIPANANRGLKVAKGDWIKFLAPDDTMRPNCIEDNMSWIAFHAEVKVLFSRINIFKDTFEPRDFLTTTPSIPYSSKGILDLGRSVNSQYKMLLICDRIHFTPSVFINREALISVNGFDERFKLLEDYPLWLNLTKKGYKLFFMDKVTVNYRRHSDAINNTGRDYLVNPNYFRSENFRRIYTYPNLPVDIRFGQRYIWFVSQIFRYKCLNKNKKPNRFLHDLLTIYMNPVRYFIWLRKKFNNKLNANEFYQ